MQSGTEVGLGLQIAQNLLVPVECVCGGEHPPSPKCRFPGVWVDLEMKAVFYLTSVTLQEAVCLGK